MSDTKGHLGVGADADLAIYDLDPDNLAPDNIEKAFSHAAYTIKNGVIVVKNGEIVQVTQGKRSWVNPQINDNLEKTMLRDIRRTFARFYTVTMANFPVQDMYVPLSNEIRIDATNIA